MSNEIVPTQQLILRKFNMITESLGLGELTITNTPLHIKIVDQQPEDMTRTERRFALWGLEELPEDAPDTTDSGATTDVTSDINVAATALNGSQITSLLEIINSIGTGGQTAESAKAIMTVAFPMFSQEQIDNIFNSLNKTAPVIQPTKVVDIIK